MYYPINKVWLGSTPVISIYHPDDAQVYYYPILLIIYKKIEICQTSQELSASLEY